MRTIQTYRDFESGVGAGAEDDDPTDEPLDLNQILLHNAQELEMIADTLRDLARTQEQFLKSGDLQKYAAMMRDLLEEPVEELWYPTQEERKFVHRTRSLFDAFRTRVGEAEKLLKYLEQEQARKGRARLRAYLQANGYKAEVEEAQNEEGEKGYVTGGWVWIAVGVGLVILLAYFCSAS